MGAECSCVVSFYVPTCGSTGLIDEYTPEGLLPGSLDCTLQGCMGEELQAVHAEMYATFEDDSFTFDALVGDLTFGITDFSHLSGISVNEETCTSGALLFQGTDNSGWWFTSTLSWDEIAYKQNQDDLLPDLNAYNCNTFVSSDTEYVFGFCDEIPAGTCE